MWRFHQSIINVLLTAINYSHAKLVKERERIGGVKSSRLTAKSVTQFSSVKCPTGAK